MALCATLLLQVMKVDTEGAEKDIIIGLRDWIAVNKPSMLLSMVRVLWVNAQ